MLLLCPFLPLVLVGGAPTANPTLQRQVPSECFKVNGADYRGIQNQTSLRNGRPCLYWDQTHQHAYNTEKYPNGELGLGNHNYCRNPDGDVQPWCYVSETEEGVYWKYCDIPTCQMPGYMGCFLDSGNPLALAGSSGTSTKLTVQVCIRFCRKKGYRYAGVEAGYACFCGNETDMRKNHRVSAVECDQVCFGKSSELCGGDGRIGIYDVAVGACEGDDNNTSGVIYSPEFPDDYGADSNCTWNVRPLGCVGMEVHFKIFEIRDENDRVELRDGHTNRILAQFDGHHKPEGVMILLTDYLLLTFQSNEIFQAQGFALWYHGVKSITVQDQELAQTEHLDGLVLSTLSDGLTINYFHSTEPFTPSIGAWMIYATSGAFVLILIITSYLLRKRTCLFIQKKTMPGVFIVNGRKSHCPGNKAWSVAYKHTKVVICSDNRKGVENSSDCSSLCDSYKDLAATKQSSLKSLISTT
ncbi:kremen protein 2 isoform X1 [Microcaecilia unicolor]|uniref:Kringle-containing protein marking the eye and the nose n=1 Tax=Microcaecilia unicolor TaxID=1415580 RepID=A0A6P7YMQ3_9AMPH|nr:kremen protein 2 isoform X1 [Microcaecilia unicolor]